MSVVYESVTVSLLCVNVPVLSVHTTEQEPKVSTANNFLIITLFLAIFCIPRANVNVNIAGNPSGIAATASDTAVINVFATGCPCNNSSTNIITHMMIASNPRVFPSLSILISSGVCLSPSS